MLKIIDELAEHVNDRIKSADVTIDGTTYPMELRRSLFDGTTIRKHIYLTQNDPSGTVSRARLLGEKGEVIAEQTYNKEHGSNEGTLLEFKFTIQEV
ncbi:hemolysin [Halobacillus trueperi]|uniref:Hemolysin n=1 Tax=Halobacillus trueperi TaxID=156205 RepID=A0A3D8VMB0_9BACI|nr:hemolysin [Halobacillus trueperi]RDY70331.1 hemolysin [Halobacillus trueperi]